MMKPAHIALVAVFGAALAACGGSASVTPSGSVQASLNPSTAASASAPASPAASASSGAAASGAASQKAPGPYTPNGSVTATNGKATIQATDTLKWQPNTITVTPGEKVTLQVKNSGNTAHAFYSPALGVTTATPVPTGKTTPVTFTAPSKAGTYQFWCNIPGHAEAGMVGEVVVK